MKAGWRRQMIVLGVAAVAISMIIAVVGSQQIAAIYLAEAAQRGENTLVLASSALRGELARYENLPKLIAEHDLVRDLVRQPENVQKIDATNLYLASINTLLASSDIYVIDGDGTTIAASNHADAVPFVGQNFSYRPYFQDAIKGDDGQFFALGTTSLKRGYYFAAPVRNGDDIDGVVAFKVDIDEVERSWHGSDFEIIVTDPEGIIFMSGRSDWLFASMKPLTDDRLARTALTQRYAGASLSELPIIASATATGYDLIEVETRANDTEYIVVSETMPEAGWTVSVLLDTASARLQVLTTVSALVLLVGLVAMAIAVYLQSRARLAERLTHQREAKEKLEIRVEERTADLAKVNKRLKQEVEERRSAERQLRQTQADLIQAGKLAALGQMSAALSHEFNQPLSAVRAYAESAVVLLDRGREADAKHSLGRIIAMVDRMASMSRHLRNFARKPKTKLRPVCLTEVVRETLEISAWRLQVANVELTLDLSPEPIWIMAGSVRLQQVLVNLIGNGADAIEHQETRFISLVAREKDGRVTIVVRDNGPGVPEAIKARIFDPFFSTRGVGKGLGLGLSISYNIVKDFGGTMWVNNLPEGGAEFVIELEMAQAVHDHAMQDADQ